MTDRAPAERSAQISARVAGAVYLIIIVGGLFAEGVREQVVVSGDAAATARNILAHELLYRFSFAAGLIVCACNLPLVLILYDFFRLMNRRLALLAVFFVLVSTAIESVNLLSHFAPIILLGGRPYLNAFTTEQLQALAYTSLRLQAIGYSISLTFFGFYCLVAGYLIFRSTLLPRAIGALLATAGACYLINSFANFLSPALAARMFPWVLVPAFVAELSLCLWLLVMGVNVDQWKEEIAALPQVHTAY